MALIKNIETNEAPIGTGPYSQAIVTDNLIFVAGQGPIDPETHKVLGKDVIEQTRYTIKNIKNILEAAGSSLDKVVKINAYLADMKDFENFNKAYQEFFKKPFPARTTIGCVLNKIKVEIDAIAEK